MNPLLQVVLTTQAHAFSDELRLVESGGDVPAFQVITHEAIRLEEGAQDAVRVEGAEGAQQLQGLFGAGTQALLPGGILDRQLPSQLAAEGLLLREEELEL